MNRDETRNQHGWTIPFEHGMVTRCWFDAGFGLTISDDAAETAEVYIEGRFGLRDEAGELAFGESDEDVFDKRRYAPLLALLGKGVTEATTLDGGFLEVRFTDRTTLTASPSPDYESWKLRIGESNEIICLPGGRLAR